jgi:hypothetical protein
MRGRADPRGHQYSRKDRSMNTSNGSERPPMPLFERGHPSTPAKRALGPNLE